MKAYYKVETIEDKIGYCDLDNYDKQEITYYFKDEYTFTEIILIEKDWFDNITELMKSGEYQPSYNELAIWTNQFDEYVSVSNIELDEEQHQNLFNEYVEQRRTLQCRTIEEFMKNNINR